VSEYALCGVEYLAESVRVGFGNVRDWTDPEAPGPQAAASEPALSSAAVTNPSDALSRADLPIYRPHDA